ncbi:GspE/PulE family protein [Pseudomonas huaxiensis]|uniref:GspE/PulE family protein n=1 Tax=Pseudomonas huaxiensis TaxID=2213017 RepID=UPI000DA687AF|nr:ATPase, T2SS/T4P/T4SS family [Pseudomonas huaxiensis]
MDIIDPLVEQLVYEGHLTREALAHAEALRVEQPQSTLPDLLLRLGMISEVQLAHTCAGLLGWPRYGASEALVQEAALPVLPLRFLRHQGIAPFGFADQGQLKVAVARPFDPYPMHAVAFATGLSLCPSVGTPSEVEQLIETLYGDGRSAMGTLAEEFEHLQDPEDIDHLKDLAHEAPVIKLVNLILQRALDLRASDVHIEPFENTLTIRYRVDGLLRAVESPPVRSAAAVISRVKIMSRLDIAERRLPQDGRISLRLAGRQVDLRVSTLPTSFGESVVMRLLDQSAVTLEFAHLGFSGLPLERLLDALQRPNGILLVTGPTGSGKTTTLYAALATLNAVERKIITVEDPVEYRLEGVNQLQVQPAIGLDFATALRSIVRQDPDVIMIGEIRDLETCRIAIQSALTGHLVLSSLHTNSASASIARLLDMGAERYLLASTLNGVLAQRLLRRLDPERCESFEASPTLVREHGLDRFTDERPIRLYRPRPDAGGDGYRGRVAISELLVMSEAIRTLLMEQADSTVLEREARREGMRTLHEEGLRLAAEGVTSLEEVLRITSSTGEALA